MHKAKCQNSSVYYSTPFLTRQRKPLLALKDRRACAAGPASLGSSHR
jgi:hypothetical protein